LGSMCELGSCEEIFSNPLHPYTKALLSSIPRPEIRKDRERIKLQGEIPSPANPPSGCRFHTRCPLAQEICAQKVPDYREVKPGHHVACHFA